MYLKLLFLYYLFICCVCLSQSDSVDVITDQVAEDLLEEHESETDDSDLYELVEYYLSHPVNLNVASLNALSSLPYIDLSVAGIIINHRQKYGKFFSVYELYSVAGIPSDLVRKILPFITIEDSSSAAGTENIHSYILSLNIRSRLQYGLQKRKGFINKMFTGSPYKIYNRLTLWYGDHITAGFLAEKDPGEVRINDFSSGYLRLNNYYDFETIIIGDYLIEFGQGLALWGPYGNTKSSEAMSVKSAPLGIIPYKSSTENMFFRGVAAEFKWEHARLSGFFSKNFMDANIDSVTGAILSTPLNGLHRTYNERLNRKTIEETAYGLTVNYNILPAVNLGFLYYASALNKPFYTSSKINNDNINFKYYSGYIDLYILNCNIFSEISLYDNSLAYVSGIRFSSSPEFSYICVIRNYPYTYKNMHGFGFAEHTGAPNNEFGIYNGFRWRTGLGTINCYYDLFKFPKASYGIPLPSEGNEFVVSFNLSAFKNMVMNTRLKIENKEVTAMINKQEKIVIRLKKSCRLEFINKFTENIRIKTRFEYSNFFIKNTGDFEEGYLIFEDLRIYPVSDFIFYLRVMFFKTASFNSAIYTYENDLAGVLKNTGLYGEGLRLYMVVRYTFLDKLKLSFKYSETYKPGKVTLGTGYEEIQGNIDNMLSLQLDLKL